MCAYTHTVIHVLAGSPALDDDVGKRSARLLLENMRTLCDADPSFPQLFTHTHVVQFTGTVLDTQRGSATEDIVVDMDFPSEWHGEDGQGSEMPLWCSPVTLRVTRGEPKSAGKPHLEGASSMYSQQLDGAKTWHLWPPGCKLYKKKNFPAYARAKPTAEVEDPLYTFQTQCGDTVVIPGGWWHTEHTATPGSIECVQTWAGPQACVIASVEGIVTADLIKLVDHYGLKAPPNVGANTTHLGRRGCMRLSRRDPQDQWRPQHVHHNVLSLPQVISLPKSTP